MTYKFARYNDFKKLHEQEDENIVTEDEFLYSISKEDLATIRLYVQQNGNLNAINEGGLCALHLCAHELNTEDIPMYLLDQKGLDVNIQENNGQYTPLMSYLEVGELYNVIKKICKYPGFDPNIKNMVDETALHLAVRYECSFDIIQLIIDSGADMEAQENFREGGYGKFTPLMLAIDNINQFSSELNTDMVDFLIKNGANLESPLTNTNGKTAKDMLQERKEQILTYKLEKQGTISKIAKNSGVF